MRTPVLTTLALLAFAANSLLCRLALRSQAIDPATFSAIRIVSGALILGLLVRWPSDAPPASGGSSWASAGLLFLYAAPFSFAYLHLGAGTGALLLFASVQVTMVLAALVRGERPRPSNGFGLTVAIAGLVYLVLPGLTAPDPFSAFLMFLAGVAWGLYSLQGRSTIAPLPQTAGNFARAVPMALVLCLVAWPGAVGQNERSSLGGALGRHRLGYRLCSLVCRTSSPHSHDGGDRSNSPCRYSPGAGGVLLLARIAHHSAGRCRGAGPRRHWHGHPWPRARRADACHRPN
jgi:drug/metabolite transporter (DMT)-like permease